MDSTFLITMQFTKLLKEKDNEIQKLKKANQELHEIIKSDLKRIKMKEDSLDLKENSYNNLQEKYNELINNLNQKEEEIQKQSEAIASLKDKQDHKYLTVNPDGSFYLADTKELEELRNTILVQLSFDNILNSIEETNNELQERLNKLNRYIKKVLGVNYADSDVTMMSYEIDNYLELAKFNQYKFEYVSTPEDTIKVTSKNGATVEITLKDLNAELTDKLVEALPKDILLNSSTKQEARAKKVEENQQQIEIQIGSTICKIDDPNSESIYKVTGFHEDAGMYVLVNNLLSADIQQRSRDKIYPLRFHARRQVPQARLHWLNNLSLFFSLSVCRAFQREFLLTVWES